MSGDDDATGVRVAAMEGRMDRHEEADVREHADIWNNGIEKLRKAVNDVTKRPPAWCTLAFSLLTFFLGMSVTLIGVLLRS